MGVPVTTARTRGRVLVGFGCFGVFWGAWGAALPAVREHSRASDGDLGLWRC